MTLRLKYSINLLLWFLGGLGISSWNIGSVHTSVPDAHGLCTDQFLTRIIRMFWRDLFKFGIFMLKLIIRICSGYISIPDDYAQQTHSSWLVCSGYASVHDAYAQHFLKTLHSGHALVLEGYANLLSTWSSSWLECSSHASVPDAYPQRLHQFLMRMQELVHTHQFLTRSLSVHIRIWPVCSVFS